ncbi:DUF262 domain-containing protein [Curtobacterium sp. MCPF17_046]|uniref:DUF262 domain-containing protein n=1 Tax=Curtobacterium sp. MCPF17_046 TaxID=2175663 RepID=UPI000D81CBEB|nr:DUF262 domain-containing protein [Curtobacterium sp. MCPF17_046]PYY35004.1 DUF262 domain-containing protein [Curtobacterium sp. MCPF17_046]
MDWDDDHDDDDLRGVTREFLPETVIWTTDWTTGALADQIDRDVFDVDPPYQRRSVWNDKKASLLIESLIVGCPVPPITLAELPVNGPHGEQYVVIDGKQRLSTLKRFMVDKTLRLTGLEILPQFNGLLFDELISQPEASRFTNVPVRTVVLRNWKKDEVLQFVFHRLNTQVTPLSTHELRRSLLAGPFTEYLDERSAQSTGIQRLLNISGPDYRLRDAELWLRALAFVLRSSQYRGNLKAFLDTTTRQLNRSWSKPETRREVSEASDDIELAIEATFSIFGGDAFQRYDVENGYSGRFNRAIFDIMVVELANEVTRERALEQKRAVRQAFESLSSDSKFAGWISTTTKTPVAVQGRLQAWGSKLSDLESSS